MTYRYYQGLFKRKKTQDLNLSNQKCVTYREFTLYRGCAWGTAWLGIPIPNKNGRKFFRHWWSFRMMVCLGKIRATQYASDFPLPVRRFWTSNAKGSMMIGLLCMSLRNLQIKLSSCIFIVNPLCSSAAFCEAYNKQSLIVSGTQHGMLPAA